MHPMGSRTDTHEIVINWENGLHVQAEVVPRDALERRTRQLDTAELAAALARAEGQHA